MITTEYAIDLQERYAAAFPADTADLWHPALEGQHAEAFFAMKEAAIKRGRPLTEAEVFKAFNLGDPASDQQW